MSQQTGLLDKTFKAGSDLSAKQYYIVKMCSSTTPYGVILGAANTDEVIGVLQNEPAMNEAAVVRVFGTTKVIAGTPIAIGEWVVSDASGKAQNVQADKNTVIGLALETASADGDIIEILLTHFTASV